MKWITKGVNVIKSIGLQIIIPAPKNEEINELDTEKEYLIEIKENRKRRSMNANAYCWVLCQKLAEYMSRDGQYISKEDVYRKAIQDCGHFQYVLVRTEQVVEFIRKWQANGIGWLAIDVGKCNAEIDGNNIQIYHGSSVYNTQEMSRLIECLIDECSQVGISTKDDSEIKALLERWESEQAETTR